MKIFEKMHKFLFKNKKLYYYYIGIRNTGIDSNKHFS